MPDVFQYLSKNAEWIFSGIGVLLVSVAGRTMWERFRKNPRVDQPLPHTASPVTGSVMQRTGSQAQVVMDAYSVASLDKAFLNRRVPVGDYLDIVKGPMSKVRITIEAIEEVADRSRFSDKETKVPAAAIRIDLGGAVAQCGTRVVKTGVNKFLVPAASRDESEDSVYYFHNAPEHSSFVRLLVEHINPHTGEVDLNFVHLSGYYRSVA